MPSLGAEMLALTLAVLGWVCAFVSCVLPMWKVTAFIGVKSFTTETKWEGIWMTCLHQSTGHVGCHGSFSTLALSSSQQAARVLTVASLLMGALGLLTASVGAKCTRCGGEEAAKARVMAAAGWAFVLAALAQIIPVSLYARAVIVRFLDPGVSEESKQDLGAALYLGWAAGALLLCGGVILCCSCSKPRKKRSDPPSVAMHAQHRPTSPRYEKKDFV